MSTERSWKTLLRRIAKSFPFLHLDPSSLTSYFPQAFSARILQHFHECYILYQRVCIMSKQMFFSACSWCVTLLFTESLFIIYFPILNMWSKLYWTKKSRCEILESLKLATISFRAKIQASILECFLLKYWTSWLFFVFVCLFVLKT